MSWRGVAYAAAIEQNSEHPIAQGVVRNSTTRFGTAKLNQIDPEAYLGYVLERIAEHPINLIDQLLPWYVATLLHAPGQLAA